MVATADDYLCAFDEESGKELWRGRLPAGGQARQALAGAGLADGTWARQAFLKPMPDMSRRAEAG